MMVLQRRRSTTHTVVLSPMGDTGLTVAEKPPALLSYIQDRQAMGMSISAISEELYSHADRAGVGCVSLSELHSSLSREEVFSSSDYELRQLLRMVKPVTSGFVGEDEFGEAFRNFARGFHDSRGHKEDSDSVSGRISQNAKSKTGSKSIESQKRTVRRNHTHDGSSGNLWDVSTAKAGNFLAGGASCRTLQSQSRADGMEGVQAATYSKRRSHTDSNRMEVGRHPGLASRRTTDCRLMTTGAPMAAPGSRRQPGARGSVGSTLITLTPAAKTNTRRSMDMHVPEWARATPSPTASRRSMELPHTPKQTQDLSTPSLRPFTGAHSSSVVSLPAIQSKADRQDHSLFPETTPHIRRVQQDQERQDLEIRETAGRSMDQHSAIRGVAGGVRTWSMVKNAVQASSAMQKLRLLSKRRETDNRSGNQEEEEELPPPPLPTFKSNFDSHAKSPHRGIKSVYLDREYLINYIPAFRGVRISRRDGTVVMDELLLHLDGRAPVLVRHLKSMTAGLKRNTVEGTGDDRTPPVRVDFKTLIGLLFSGSSDRDIQGCIDACEADGGRGMGLEETEVLDSIEEAKALFDCLDTDSSGTVSRVKIINGKRKGLVHINEQDIDRICATPYKRGAEAVACFDDFYEWHSSQVQASPSPRTQRYA